MCGPRGTAATREVRNSLNVNHKPTNRTKTKQPISVCGSPERKGAADIDLGRSDMRTGRGCVVLGLHSSTILGIFIFATFRRDFARMRRGHRCVCFDQHRGKAANGLEIFLFLPE